MKKKLAILLCSVMCTGLFAGCSNDELALMKVSNDIANVLENGKITGTLQAEINFDEMHVQVTKLAESYYAEGYEVKKQEDLQGKKSFVVDYELNTNQKEEGYTLSVDVKYNGKTYDFGTIYHTAEEGTFVARETLLNAYQLLDDVDAGEVAHFKLADDYAKEYKKIVGENAYIKLTEGEASAIDMEQVLSDQAVGKLYSAVVDLFTNALEGHQTGLVKAISNGIEISGTGLTVGQGLANVMYFFAENPVRLIDETEKFANKVLEDIEKDTKSVESAKEEIKALFASARTESAEIAKTVKEIGNMIEEAIKEDHMKILLEGFNFKETVVKSAEGYEASGFYQMKNGENEVFSIKKNETYQKTNAGITTPKNFVQEEELQADLIALEDKYNPVTGIEIDWGFDEEGTEALLYTVRKMPAYAKEPMEWTTVLTENETAYIPLRLIAEKLGETVGWERETQTAYIMKNGKRIDMHGKLKEKLIYVDMQDFGKLGYTVTVNVNADGINEVKIMK